MNKEFMTEVHAKARAILTAVVDESKMDEKSNAQLAQDMLTGQAALIEAFGRNLTALVRAEFVPQDLGRALLERFRDLATDIQKAMLAQAILDANRAPNDDVDSSKEKDGNVLPFSPTVH